jgi:hypothetical protein
MSTFNLIFTKSGNIDGRCQLAKFLANNGFDYSHLATDDFEFESNGTVKKNCGGYLEIQSNVGECNFRRMTRPGQDSKKALKSRNIIFTKSGKIDGRSQIAKDIITNGGNIEEISSLEFVFNKDSTIDKDCDGYQAIESIVGPVEIICKEAKSGSKNDRNILFRTDGGIDGRCQIARDLRNTKVNFDELTINNFSFDERGIAIEDCVGCGVICEVLGDDIRVITTDKSLWGRYTATKVPTNAPFQPSFKSSPFQPSFKSSPFQPQSSIFRECRNIFFKNNGEIDARCQIAKDLRNTKVNFSELTVDKFDFDNNGVAVENCVGCAIIGEILGDGIRITTTDRSLWGRSKSTNTSNEKPFYKPQKLKKEPTISNKYPQAPPQFVPQQQMKQTYVRNGNAVPPPVMAGVKRVPLKPKQMKQKLPKEYYEMINSIAVNRISEEDVWNDISDVYTGSQNQTNIADPFESWDSNILTCINNKENLPSNEASIRLKNIWQVITSLDFPDSYKMVARELFNGIRDENNRVIVRKNAKLNNA